MSSSWSSKAATLAPWLPWLAAFSFVLLIIGGAL
jgi:hypothetical protein